MNKIDAMHQARHQYDACTMCGWGLKDDKPPVGTFDNRLERHVIQVDNFDGKDKYLLDHFTVVCSACFKERNKDKTAG